MAHALTPITRCEHERRVQRACPILSPTGCTSQFCQSGKMSRPFEPRVGENRALQVIKNEAEAFLHEMLDEGRFVNRQTFEDRLQEVITEIDAGAVETTVWAEIEEIVDSVRQLKRVRKTGVSSRGWHQTEEEVSWGVQVAWRNSRKCIMRAHYQDLSLVDFRNIRTSKGMLDAIIEKLPFAYNGGRIQPTVFLFPARELDQTGPMFWSPQLLTYAGYELPQGHVLGDPANVQITKDTMDLGWNPPEPRSRWDILPVVAMAEGDEPAWAELPAELVQPIHIRHPSYGDAFDALDLRWCRFPALSRLGFDIGGVQYTASPFLGWFMDAEIAARNLSDTFRYNVLPEVIQAIGWKKKDLDFEDLPDHERLLWMSRAQAELNYAVQYSFMQAGVISTSSLTASQSWSAFDDQHFQEKGYRLNADPYWIAPPQGSIIPLWHRGAAPNYQPKPLIAKHRYDPVTVWKKRRAVSTESKDGGSSEISETTLVNSVQEGVTRVHILWAGTGGTAVKLAERLRKSVIKKVSSTTLCQFGALNSTSADLLHPGDVVLVVISTTGQGQIPQNGQHFIQKMHDLQTNPVSPLHFSIFGLGDSGYYSTFNAAAITLGSFFNNIGAVPIGPKDVIKSDAALESPPLLAFKSWWDMIDQFLDGVLDTKQDSLHNADSDSQNFAALNSYDKGVLQYHEQGHIPGRILTVSIEASSQYEEMSHIRLVPRNSANQVNRIMYLLSIYSDPALSTISLLGLPHTIEVRICEFLSEYVDLEQPFRSLDWMADFAKVPAAEFGNIPVIETLVKIFLTGTSRPLSSAKTVQILQSMKPHRPRCYSIASSPITCESSTTKSSNAGSINLEILVRIIPNGRFSWQTLSKSLSGTSIRYKLQAPSPAMQSLAVTEKPIVAVAVGTGFGPIRGMIQRRIKEAAVNDHTERDGGLAEPAQQGKIILFLGFKNEDSKIFTETIQQASAYNIFDAVRLVPSNAEKIRVQDCFLQWKELLARKLVVEKGWLHVCGGAEMVRGIKAKMEETLGNAFWAEIIGEGRLIEEVF